MKNQKRTPIFLAEAGLIGGAYAALCLILAPISYGPLQVRVA
ncbi:MAG: QueT transporter family protein [Clostridia bacterium]|nr:QueT transporter family protein [Clostridia bacterium]